MKIEGRAPRPVAPYDTDEYREWNRARMADYRRGPYGLREYIARRERDLGAQRAQLEHQAVELEAMRDELVREFPWALELEGRDRVW